MKLNKKNLMPSIVLGAICVLVAALLAVLNMLTAPVIAAETERRQQQSLMDVFPKTDAYADLSFEEIETLTDCPESVTGVYKECAGRGYALLLSTRTSYTTSGTMMNITVAISPEGELLGIALTSYTESRDIGKTTYPQQFIGKDHVGVNEVPLVSGASVSSGEFRRTLGEAFLVLENNGLIGGDGQ